jgi:hypothetical protein
MRVSDPEQPMYRRVNATSGKAGTTGPYVSVWDPTRRGFIAARTSAGSIGWVSETALEPYPGCVFPRVSPDGTRQFFFAPASP